MYSFFSDYSCFFIKKEVLIDNNIQIFFFHLEYQAI